MWPNECGIGLLVVIKVAAAVARSHSGQSQRACEYGNIFPQYFSTIEITAECRSKFFTEQFAGVVFPFEDETYMYRLVSYLTIELVLLEEREWRDLGLCMSRLVRSATVHKTLAGERGVMCEVCWNVS